MKLRLTALLLAVPAVVFGALVAVPTTSAEANTYDAAVSQRLIAINTSGLGKVTVKCWAKVTCRGRLSFTNTSTRYRSYSVPAGATRTVEVAVRTTEAAYPYPANGGIQRGDVYYKSAVLIVNQDYPRNKNRTYSVQTETLLTHQQLKGSVQGPDGKEATGVKVEMVRQLRGGNTQVVRSADIPDGGGNYSFNVPLGSNNATSGPYRLRISGRDKDDTFRSWYWRGANGSAFGSGGRYIDEGTSVRVTKMGDYDANFVYGSIGGTVQDHINGGSAEITVAAPPPVYSTNSKVLREYDFTSCANIYGKTTSNSTTGAYRVDFLPLYGGNPRYMVRAASAGVETWNTPAGGTTGFGSCLDVIDYTNRTAANLVPVPASAYNVQVRRSNNSVNIDGSFSGFSPTFSDRYVTLREKIPGVPVLSSPVVARGSVNTSGNASGVSALKNVPPGKYWVEMGRRTTCSAWYPSVYPNNNAYFSGEDRGAERWKTVAGKYPEYKKSYTMGYVAKTPPRGYKGWMYRGYCKALGAGTYDNTLNISNLDQTVTKVTSRVRKGAIVKGRVTRVDGKTNKEMMVTLSSSDGKRVLRTDLTDSRGYFYVAGLPSGNWRITVNADSWRGIGRSFSGKHSIGVTAGGTYNAGTLRFLS